MWSNGPFRVSMLDGTTRVGALFRDRAEWTCPCGVRLDIASAQAFAVTGGVRLDCPDCARHYFLSGGMTVIGERSVQEVVLPTR